VKRLCALYGVTRAGFYAWRARGESRRRRRDRELLAEIGVIFARSGGTYGSPRVHGALAAQGVAVSRRRVERLMRTHGLRARVARVYRPNPGLHRMYERNPNLLWKHRARRPGRVWVADITFLPVAGKWHYLAMVMDQCSRRVLGWSLGRVRNGRLTRRAFDLAVRRHRPERGLILHSDRGSEYGGTTLRRRLRDLGVRQSMTRGGCPGDNAHMESFFHSMKAEVIHGARFADDSQLRSCIQAYVRFYNHERLHSSLGYRSPVEYERRVA
jgi:putative transposase